MAKVVLEKPKEKQPRRSTEKPSAWEFGGLTWLQLSKRVWKSMDAEHDDTFGRAAELAYYSFLAVFPGLLFLMTLLGLIAGSHPEFRNTLLQYIGRAIPPDAWGVVQRTLTETTTAAGGWKLVVGLLGALWSASAGMSSFMTVLNFAYHVRERRPFWKSRLVIAPLLTIAITVLMFAALGIVLFGNAAATWAGAHGLGAAAVIAWKVLQYPVALFFVVLGFAALYYFAPDVEDQKWYWITPGSVIGVLLWVAVSVVFRVYLHFFNSYSATYGSLGAVIVLMLWFYISCLAILAGAEINAEIEHAAAEHGRADAKLKGEKEAPAA